MRKILVIGATSAIAEATARLFAENGDRLFLVGRRIERLQQIAADLEIRGAAGTGAFAMDVNDLSRHLAMLAQAEATLGGIDTVLIAHGTLPDQRACEQDVDLTLRELNTNALSTIALLTRIANRFEANGQGTIAVISSVAGDRGRQSNYVYGAAKAAVSTFLQGLRNRLHSAEVQVLTVKPGFVDTPMTADFPKGALWAKPDGIARGIVKAIERRKDVVYLPWFWWGIMAIIKSIPERMFKRGRL
jgi:short-subunit dehydrogenase